LHFPALSCCSTVQQANQRIEVSCVVVHITAHSQTLLSSTACGIHPHTAPSRLCAKSNNSGLCCSCKGQEKRCSRDGPMQQAGLSAEHKQGMQQRCSRHAR
jgi:hypothetical protein